MSKYDDVMLYIYSGICYYSNPELFWRLFAEIKTQCTMVKEAHLIVYIQV